MTTATVPATTTSPTGNAVLVLSTNRSSNKPMIVDFEGKFRDFKQIYSFLKEILTKTWLSSMATVHKLNMDAE